MGAGLILIKPKTICAVFKLFMKNLYEFSLDKEQEVEETAETLNEKGETVKTITKVKKNVPIKFQLKKPSRQLIDEAELYQGEKISEGIKAGMLSVKMLEKRFLDDGGVLSKDKIEELKRLNIEFVNFKKEYEELNAKEDKTDKEITELLERVSDIRNKIQTIQLEELNAYEQTAEARARNKTVMWWIVNLAYQDDKPLFDAKKLENKLDKYHDMVEEGDAFEKKVANKFALLVSFWFTGRATTKEEFEVVEKSQSF